MLKHAVYVWKIALDVVWLMHYPMRSLAIWNDFEKNCCAISLSFWFSENQNGYKRILRGHPSFADGFSRLPVRISLNTRCGLGSFGQNRTYSVYRRPPSENDKSHQVSWCDFALPGSPVSLSRSLICLTRLGWGCGRRCIANAPHLGIRIVIQIAVFLQ